ncbi:MAG: SOS response-associated peptidase [Polyangiales bacterium]
MCGRFTLTIAEYADIARLLGVEPDPMLAEAWRPRFNVAPGTGHFLLAHSARAPGGRAMLPARWGFGPRSIPLVRSDTVRTQAMSASAFETARVLVPTDGFFEWGGPKDDRRPTWFHAGKEASSPLVLLGAVMHRGADGVGFAIVTRDADEVIATVHDRMPVVVPQHAIDAWLYGAKSEAAALMVADHRPRLVATPVTKHVNSTKHDDVACITPATADERRGKQLKLFG